MTVQVNEKIGSRTLETHALASATAKRVFVVFNDDPSADTLTPAKALRTRGVPQINDFHPESSSMKLTGHGITSNTGSDCFITIVCNYSVTAAEVFTAITTGVRGLFMDAWRNYPDPPPVNLGQNGSIPISGDIGGQPVDIGGKAISLSIFQQTVEVRSPFANEPDFDLIRNLTNQRNDSTWMGFPRGVLLYLGASATADSGNIWTTTHKFAADPIFHARQIAQRDADGKVTQATYVGNSYTQAAYVYWVQKFPNLGNFYDLVGIIP